MKKISIIFLIFIALTLNALAWTPDTLCQQQSNNTVSEYVTCMNYFENITTPQIIQNNYTITNNLTYTNNITNNITSQQYYNNTQTIIYNNSQTINNETIQGIVHSEVQMEMTPFVQIVQNLFNQQALAAAPKPKDNTMLIIVFIICLTALLAYFIYTKHEDKKIGMTSPNLNYSGLESARKQEFQEYDDYSNVQEPRIQKAEKLTKREVPDVLRQQDSNPSDKRI